MSFNRTNSASAPQQSPLVSVIMPVYQNEDLVKRAVASVLGQTYPHLELIVINDGSTDGTLDVLAAIHDDRLTVISQQNQGVAAARNFGLLHARGEYLAFLDADDLWFPEKLATELQVLQSQPDPVGIVYSGYYAVDESDRLVNLSAAYTQSGMVVDAAIRNEGLFLPSTSMMHRQIYDALGGFPLNSYHEDRVFFIRACKHFPAYPAGQRLVIYRQSMSGRCRSILQNYEAALQAELSIVNALKPDLSEAEIALLASLQTRNLMYRFLMYNFIASARNLMQKVNPALLMKDKKGVLAMVSLKGGINLLYGCRVSVQFFTRFFLYPWWRLKSASAYNASL